MTQVYSVEETPKNDHRILIPKTIQEQKIFNTLKSDKRLKLLRQILHGTMEEKISIKYVFYVFATILLTYIISCYMTLIPVHNLIENPQYWWETMLHIPNAQIPMFAGYIIVNCSFWMNTIYVMSLKHFFIFGWRELHLVLLLILRFT